MAGGIRINVLGRFEIFAGETPVHTLLHRSRKGAMLFAYLLLNRGETVSAAKLMDALWSSDEIANPESALKTLVSRLRATLASGSPALAECVGTARGGYQWSAPEGVFVDLFEVETLCDELEDVRALTPDTRTKYSRLIELFRGGLLPEFDSEEWAEARAVYWHERYLRIACQYLAMLEAQEDYETVIAVSRAALAVDAFDERLHVALMSALVKTRRANDALQQYKYATNLHFKYLGVQPPESIQAFYTQILRAGETLDFDIDVIRRELMEYGEVKGAFVCEYAVFKEIFNLQMRNLERVGSSMYIALIMVTGMGMAPIEPVALDGIMSDLLHVLRGNLRKGDTITRFSPSQYALLLPTVNAQTGAMVMDRVRRAFYKTCGNPSVLFSYRIGPLSSQQAPPAR